MKKNNISSIIKKDCDVCEGKGYYGISHKCEACGGYGFTFKDRK